jgi:transcription initiation factor IIE alpha subunit
MIMVDDVEFAAELVVSSIRSCEAMIDEAVSGDGAYAKSLFRIRKMLIAKERMPKRDLLRAMHVRIRELDEVLESLAEQGHVKYEKDGKQDMVVWVN